MYHQLLLRHLFFLLVRTTKKRELFRIRLQGQRNPTLVESSEPRAEPEISPSPFFLGGGGFRLCSEPHFPRSLKAMEIVFYGSIFFFCVYCSEGNKQIPQSYSLVHQCS